MNPNTFTPIDGAGAALPSTMAGILESAIDDARKLDKSIYYPHFQQWHESQSHAVLSVCQVCLAGSLIAGKLQVSSSDSLTPSCFDNRTHRLLLAIDDMRNGEWVYAFNRIYGCTPGEALEDKLQLIPSPDCIEFNGWKQFETHLASLEQLLPQLRQIDRIWKDSPPA